MEPALEKLRQGILSLSLELALSHSKTLAGGRPKHCVSHVCVLNLQKRLDPPGVVLYICRLHILQTKQKDGLKLKANLGYIMTSRPVLSYRLRPYPKKPKEKKKPNVPSLSHPLIRLFFSLISGNSVLTGSIFCNGRRKSLWVFSPNRTKTPHLKLPPTCPSYPPWTSAIWYCT